MEPEQVLETIASRYIGSHPSTPFTFRSFSRDGFRQLDDGRFDINLEHKLPNATCGQWAFAFGKVWSNSESSWETAVSCYGPLRIHVNGNRIYRSEIIEEVNPQMRVPVRIPLQPGWNGILLSFRKTPSGFGGIIGTVRSKWGTPTIQAPFSERSGQAGWIYSSPTDSELCTGLELPRHDDLEQDCPYDWHPKPQWSEAELRLGMGSRMFGMGEGRRYAYGWSRMRCKAKGVVRYVLRLSALGPSTVWLDGKEVLSVSEAGSTEREIEMAFGVRDVLVRFVAGESDWGYMLEATYNGERCEFEQPYAVRGTEESWFYLGPFESGRSYSPHEIQTLQGVWEEENGGIYWRLDKPDTWIRPYLENENFARWSYPIGVTLYGLLQTARMLNRPDIGRYVFDHIGTCTRMYAYSLWEKLQYGYPAINNQLAELDMLDDCGSLASTMLEAYEDCSEPSFLWVAERVADFMMSEHERKEDGVFYRSSPGYFMENTLWGDDLYMSVPFLIRYARLSDCSEYLNEAAKQMMLFRKYLYMSDQRMLSHVYDFKHETATGVAWGRGNGWPLFSLSELLEVLPPDHVYRAELEAFFRELCSGLLERQGINGLWHQVLTDPESYEETSCTAMFIYAFCRGLRFAWLHEDEAYALAVRKGWESLTRHAIDQWGNVHGVCRGSRYSFSPSYYKEDLLWTTNDTHGIGIVMLAGIEVAKLLSEWEQ
ncbi:glycoside hydrolase family 88/105 protein [Paenibacillus sp. PL2-23]